MTLEKLKGSQNKNAAWAVFWFNQYAICCEARNTEAFSDLVDKFYKSLIDLGDNKFAVRSIIDTYLKEEWVPYFNKTFIETCRGQGINPNDQLMSRGTHNDLLKVLNEDLLRKIMEVVQQAVGAPTDEDVKLFKEIREME